MKKQLEEMQRYFENKILAGEFKVIMIDMHTANITIDGLSFSIWISNGYEYVETYQRQYNTINIVFKNKKGVYAAIKQLGIGHEAKEQCEVCDWIDSKMGIVTCKNCDTTCSF